MKMEWNKEFLLENVSSPKSAVETQRVARRLTPQTNAQFMGETLEQTLKGKGKSTDNKRGIMTAKEPSNLRE